MKPLQTFRNIARQNKELPYSVHPGSPARAAHSGCCTRPPACARASHLGSLYLTIHPHTLNVNKSSRGIPFLCRNAGDIPSSGLQGPLLGSGPSSFPCLWSPWPSRNSKYDPPLGDQTQGCTWQEDCSRGCSSAPPPEARTRPGRRGFLHPKAPASPRLIRVFWEYILSLYQHPAPHQTSTPHFIFSISSPICSPAGLLSQCSPPRWLALQPAVPALTSAIRPSCPGLCHRPASLHYPVLRGQLATWGRKGRQGVRFGQSDCGTTGTKVVPRLQGQGWRVGCGAESKGASGAL